MDQSLNMVKIAYDALDDKLAEDIIFSKYCKYSSVSSRVFPPSISSSALILTAELQKIGVNINQIARRLNSMGPLYTQDVADIKEALAQIWQLQRYILSSQR